MQSQSVQTVQCGFGFTDASGYSCIVCTNTNEYMNLQIVQNVHQTFLGLFCKASPYVYPFSQHAARQTLTAVSVQTRTMTGQLSAQNVHQALRSVMMGLSVCVSNVILLHST